MDTTGSPPLAAAPAISAARDHLPMLQGAALTTGAVLGTGVITLPALAVRIAGPASILSWVLLVLVSIPLAATFASLGARGTRLGPRPGGARRAPRRPHRVDRPRRGAARASCGDRAVRPARLDRGPHGGRRARVGVRGLGGCGPARGRAPGWGRRAAWVALVATVVLAVSIGAAILGALGVGLAALTYRRLRRRT
ncbi:MAG: hypothetical protein ACYC1E_07830 [Propionibacteriaceae bacterium]